MLAAVEPVPCELRGKPGNCHIRCIRFSHTTHLKFILGAVQLSSKVDEKIQAFRTTLEPLRQTLIQFQWLGGNRVSYADISVASRFLVSKHRDMHHGMYVNH